ncbi:Ribosomal_L28-domain-containing protein [Fragilariopsis cylindrus CCMP1102]|uniref:Large ribosomal subunit protein bL28c n=1 Tax=Fragilariopsis cylindrus CCMP1102 TaxID=635003 RepID=A0A1E7FR95_9STRA|nr:Ribosomal_L28-domain-containing protein [Fragilariopsis cylindrus CCMP1102]|eukprot:OEU20690.1 Ribosomal_L28-domain-containing protein [Fragilariopsis cylindrus CCMP1102]
MAIAQATAFMGTPVVQRQAVSQQRSGASSMEMRARVCDLLGKEPNRQARVVTFSHKRIKKVQHVNLQSKRFFSEELDRKVKLRVSTKGIKTINKLGGIDAAARKFKVNLKNF